jgi:hypothetical protein
MIFFLEEHDIIKDKFIKYYILLKIVIKYKRKNCRQFVLVVYSAFKLSVSISDIWKMTCV